MTAMAESRKSYSIQDYPEHLNPFHEEDNHNKIRFWTISRKLNRSNSINFSGIKDIKNSWAFRSFMKKGKKKRENEIITNNSNGDVSPILYRRALQYSSNSSNTASRSTVASPERYVYGGSITPLPRSRFQERLRSSSQNEVNSLDATPRMARSEVTGSRLSVGSTNPFDEDGPVAPVRARRKKNRAPLPPTPHSVADTTITSEKSDIAISEANGSILSQEPISNLSQADIDLAPEDINFNVELKIVEDDDLAETNNNNKTSVVVKEEESSIDTVKRQNDENVDVAVILNNALKSSDSEDDILGKGTFPKVDIVKYRRNSSVNEDDIKLRRGNLEDFHALTTKRSKSLNNALDGSYTTYDINLNESVTINDPNGNDEPQKVVCKLQDMPRKQSTDTISSTEKDFMEIDKATRELEREISKLNSALNEEDVVTGTGARLSVSDIKRRFDKSSSPNPIPKPRRSHYGEPASPINLE